MTRQIGSVLVPRDPQDHAHSSYQINIVLQPHPRHSWSNLSSSTGARVDTSEQNPVEAGSPGLLHSDPITHLYGTNSFSIGASLIHYPHVLLHTPNTDPLAVLKGVGEDPSGWDQRWVSFI